LYGEGHLGLGGGAGCYRDRGVAADGRPGTRRADGGAADLLIEIGEGERIGIAHVGACLQGVHLHRVGAEAVGDRLDGSVPGHHLDPELSVAGNRAFHASYGVLQVGVGGDQALRSDRQHADGRHIDGAEGLHLGLERGGLAFVHRPVPVAEDQVNLHPGAWQLGVGQAGHRVVVVQDQGLGQRGRVPVLVPELEVVRLGLHALLGEGDGLHRIGGVDGHVLDHGQSPIGVDQEGEVPHIGIEAEVRRNT